MTPDRVTKAVSAAAREQQTRGAGAVCQIVSHMPGDQPRSAQRAFPLIIQNPILRRSQKAIAATIAVGLSRLTQSQPSSHQYHRTA